MVPSLQVRTLHNPVTAISSHMYKPYKMAQQHTNQKLAETAHAATSNGSHFERVSGDVQRTNGEPNAGKLSFITHIQTNHSNGYEQA
jgi:hypothetical protein